LLEHLRKYDAVLNASGKPVKKLKFGQRITLKKSWMKPAEVGLMQRKGCAHFKVQGRNCDPSEYEEALRLLVVEYDACPHGTRPSGARPEPEQTPARR
jgi:collagenase-like PrtC family protease